MTGAMNARRYLDLHHNTSNIDSESMSFTIDKTAELMEEFALHSPSQLDNVTVKQLSVALRMVGVVIDDNTIDKIIDLVELIAMKGKDTTMMDVIKAETEWNY